MQTVPSKLSQPLVPPFRPEGFKAKLMFSCSYKQMAWMLASNRNVWWYQWEGTK